MANFGSLGFRIYSGLFLAIVLTIVVAGIVFFSLLGGYRQELVDNTLRQQADQVRFGLEQFTQRRVSLNVVALYLERLSEETGTLLFVLDADGTVVQDLSPAAEFDELQLPIDLSAVRDRPNQWIAGEVNAAGVTLPFLARLVPVDRFGRPAFIAVALPDDSTGEIVSDLVPRLLISGLAGLAAALVVGLVITRSVYNPLRRLTVAAQAVGRGRYDTRVPESGPRETRQLASAFNRMTSQVEENERTLQEFMADISHELRTPLTSIRGFTQALTDGTVQDADQRAHSVEVIDTEALRMLRLVEDLLDLSRMQAGEFRLQREPVDPGELLTHVADVFSQRAEEKGIALRVEADDALPTLALDFDRMVQVLGNLVDNAVRHTAEGGIVLSGSISADGQAVRLVVGDTGEGIAPEELAHLFERFYRGSSTAQRRGTGLGLAIAREIVRGHGGEIEARSTPAEGTEFVITLPIEAKAPDG